VQAHRSVNITSCFLFLFFYICLMFPSTGIYGEHAGYIGDEMVCFKL
jgi:hypothetical protein